MDYSPWDHKSHNLCKLQESQLSMHTHSAARKGLKFSSEYHRWFSWVYSWAHHFRFEDLASLLPHPPSATLLPWSGHRPTVMTTIRSSSPLTGHPLWCLMTQLGHSWDLKSSFHHPLSVVPLRYLEVLPPQGDSFHRHLSFHLIFQCQIPCACSLVSQRKCWVAIMSHTGPGCQERDKGRRKRGEKTGSFTRKNCKT